MRKGSDDKFSNDEFGVEGPAWADGKIINEAMFCEEFLSKHKILFSAGSFFTAEGRVVDEVPLKRMVFDDLKICAATSVPQKISNIVELLKIQALDETFAPETDRIHLQNGTLYIDGNFDESKSEIVRSRLPINYNPNAPVPKLWLSFLGELLYPEDIPTLQEFLGYCLIPSNKGQRMMIIKGNGGEGKSQIGAVITTLFGCNMKDGSIGKISENRFARADLEHILLCIDDDLRMEGLKHTNYVKSIVTAQGKMDLEKKNKQSYQGYMYARLLAFSNGDLQAMFDKSDGFFRRQLVLTTKDKNTERIDDPHIADKMREEIEGIFLWAFEGLQRLLANNFQFTESERAKSNRETVKRNNVNAVEFMESDGYFAFTEDIPKLLNMVDESKISFSVGVELSYLTKTEQTDLFKFIEKELCTPSLSQAQKLKKLSQDDKLNQEEIYSIMKQPKANQVVTVKIPDDKISKYLKPTATVKEKEDFLARAVEYYGKHLMKQKDRGAR